jgi:hypothetical protein
MSWGDVRNDGRLGLTGTLIEGSIDVKHRNLVLLPADVPRMLRSAPLFCGVMRC